mmetsp:Transcript_65258/g.181443  ORF Transcript_65258/g.181443 Transcript_65258/m.181443 type:complete len:207 (-) Transcript_65258:671-1291(-)
MSPFWPPRWVDDPPSPPGSGEGRREDLAVERAACSGAPARLPEDRGDIVIAATEVGDAGTKSSGAGCIGGRSTQPGGKRRAKARSCGSTTGARSAARRPAESERPLEEDRGDNVIAATDVGEAGTKSSGTTSTGSAKKPCDGDGTSHPSSAGLLHAAASGQGLRSRAARDLPLELDRGDIVIAATEVGETGTNSSGAATTGSAKKS